MSNWAIQTNAQPIIGGAGASNEYPGIILDNPATIHTKGAWTQVMSGSTAAISGIEIISGVGAGDDRMAVLLDVGIGSVGSEVVIAENVIFSGAPYGGLSFKAVLPIFIPSNTPVSLRYQRGTVTPLVELGVKFHPYSAYTPTTGRLVTIGANTTGTTGVSFDSIYGEPGTVFELTSSTPVAARGIQIRFIHQETPSSQGSNSGGFRIFFGSVGNEVMISDWLRIPYPYGNYEHWMPIPQGTRISIRSKNNNDINRFAMVGYLYQ